MANRVGLNRPSAVPSWNSKACPFDGIWSWMSLKTQRVNSRTAFHVENHFTVVLDDLTRTLRGVSVSREDPVILAVRERHQQRPMCSFVQIIPLDRGSVVATPLFSLRENAITKEPGLSYPESWRCVSRLGCFGGGSDSSESSPYVTLSRGAFSAPSLVTPLR